MRQRQAQLCRRGAPRRQSGRHPVAQLLESLEPATVHREVDGNEIEMAFRYVRAQRRPLT